jgi:thymidine phosphorylase
VWGGALNLAPADDKIINVEKTLMIDAESQLLASIMAKKASAGSTHVVIDIPIGPNTKITDKKMARNLEHKFEYIGKKLGMKVKVVLTDGRQPIGNGIGPALEAIDVLKVLRQDKDRPMDLEEKCLMMAAELFTLAGRKNGYAVAKEFLTSGKAYAQMKKIIKMQGGNPDITPEKIVIDEFTYDVTAVKSGKIRHFNNLAIAKIARLAGAPQNKGAGIYLYKHLNDIVKKGDVLFTIYAGSQAKLDYIKQMMPAMGTIIAY